MRTLLLSYKYPALGGGVAAAHYARVWARQRYTVTTDRRPDLRDHCAGEPAGRASDASASR